MKRIDRSRGQLSRSEFLECLVHNWCLEQDSDKRYVSQEDFREFEEETKMLLKNFLDFFVSYGLELGRVPAGNIPLSLDHLQPSTNPTHRENGGKGGIHSEGLDLPPSPPGRS